MHRYCKVLLGSAAAVVLISGATVLTTREASAQINIEGLIRGAMSHYGGGYYRHHRSGGRVHEVRHERGSKEAKDDDKDDGLSKGKGDQKVNQSADIGNKDAKPSNAPTQADPGMNNKSQPETTAASNTPPPPPPAPAAQTPKGNSEIPAFSPSR
jgi:hypothetical protein